MNSRHNKSYFYLVLTTILSFYACNIFASAAETTPEIFIFDDRESQGNACARVVIEKIKENQIQGKRTVLGFATGSTPIFFYNAFIRMVKEDSIDLSTTITFNLDEYVGLPPNHSESYAYFMEEHLFCELAYPHYPLGFRREHIFLPQGMAKRYADLSTDEQQALKIQFGCTHVEDSLTSEEENWILQFRADQYESLIDTLGPIDIQILGIGTNGHIGFGEPGSSFTGTTMVVNLTENTRRDNARFFDNNIDFVPYQAITMGIGTILKAKSIILMANGANKAAIIAQTLSSPISEQLPATALRQHSSVSFFLDQYSAENLSLCEQ